MQAIMECRNAVDESFIMGYRKGTPEYKRLKGLKSKSDWMEMGPVAEAFPVAPLQMQECNREIWNGDLAELSTPSILRRKRRSLRFPRQGSW